MKEIASERRQNVGMWHKVCFPTLEMVSGRLKSFPPCSLKPHGAGPLRVTL